MKMTNIYNSLIAVLVLLAVAGCASPIDKNLRDAAAPGVTFPMVFGNPDAYRGDTVVWGGSVIKMLRTRTGSVVYILQTDLGLRDKPEANDTSAGRFIAITDRKLDPLVYAKGRKVTVAGTVTGKKIVNNKKARFAYTYPVVKADQLYLWKQAKELVPPYWEDDPYGDTYYDDFDFGGWGGGDDDPGDVDRDNDRGGRDKD